MTFTLLDPPLPSFAIWRRMTRLAPGQTVLRALEHELPERLEFPGRVLDFGGGAGAGFTRWLTGATEILSVNIDEEFAPTHVVPPGDPLPFPDGHFDTIVTFNTLEHVYDDVAVLAELARVLKPGGALHIIVPFLFRVHGHPDDYNRHTPSWWARTLDELGLSETRLLPLVFGRRTTAQMISGRGGRILRPLTGAIGATRDILTAKLLFGGKSHYTGRRGERVWSQSPGWYIHARK